MPEVKDTKPSPVKTGAERKPAQQSAELSSTGMYGMDMYGGTTLGTGGMYGMDMMTGGDMYGSSGMYGMDFAADSKKASNGQINTGAAPVKKDTAQIEKPKAETTAPVNTTTGDTATHEVPPVVADKTDTAINPPEPEKKDKAPASQEKHEQPANAVAGADNKTTAETKPTTNQQVDTAATKPIVNQPVVNALAIPAVTALAVVSKTTVTPGTGTGKKEEQTAADIKPKTTGKDKTNAAAGGTDTGAAAGGDDKAGTDKANKTPVANVQAPALTPGGNDATKPESLAQVITAKGDAKKPAETKQSPKKEIPKLTATSDPSALLTTLKQTPASDLALTFNQVQVTGKDSLNMQATQAEKDLPVVNAADGSAYKGDKRESAKQPTKTPQSKTAPAANINTKPPAIQAKNTPPVKNAVYSLPTVTPKTADAAADQQQAQQQQNRLDSVNINVASVPTDAPFHLPDLDHQNQLDHAQLDADTSHNLNDVTAASTDAGQEVYHDYGENNVVKNPGHDKLKASHTFKPPVIANKKLDTSVALTPDAEMQLNAGMLPDITDKIGQQENMYSLRKADYEAKTGAEKTKADAQINNEQNKSVKEQLSAESQAQKEVAGHRQDWHKEIDKTVQDYNTGANKASAEHKTQIDTEKTKGQNDAQKAVDDAQADAAQKQTEANAKAAAKKQEGQEQSKGFFGWLADKASAFIDGIKAALNTIFDELRAAVKFIFDKAKALALKALDLARQAIVGLIKAYAAVLKTLVSVAFAAFPGIRDKMLSRIDKAVNKAIEITNKTFAAFKKAVTQIIDTLASIVDGYLAILQAAYNLALDAIGWVVNKVIKAAAFIAKMIDFFMHIGDFIDACMDIYHNPDKILGAIKDGLAKYINTIPGKVAESFGELASKFGPKGKKHLKGIWHYLSQSLVALKTTWWEQLKKTGKNLLWPWPAVGEDLTKIGQDVKLGWKHATSGDVSAATDDYLHILQALNSIAGNLSVWVSIAIVLISTIIGAFFGGAGAIPGFFAGLEIAADFGEVLLLSLIATESGVILKSIIDLNTEGRTPAQDDADYQAIAGSSLTLGITGAMMLLGAIAGKLASAIWDGAKSVFTKFKPGEDLELPVDVEGEGNPTEKTETNMHAPGDGKVLDQVVTDDGTKLEFTDKEKCLVCASPCEEIGIKYKAELDANPKFAERVKSLSERLPKDGEIPPELKEEFSKLEKDLQQAKYKANYKTLVDPKTGKLKANMKYKTGEFDYNASTDAYGNIDEVHTDNLQMKEGERLSHNSKTADKLKGDHAGHLIGDRFGGSPELDNLVSQTSDVNLSKFKVIENEWADALTGNPPQRVQMSIKVNYPEGGVSARPSEFIVRYKIGNGRWRTAKLIN